MGKRLIIKAILVLALPGFAIAQKYTSPTILDNTCLMQATISPGYWFYKGGLWNSYFHATLEWGFDHRISIRADGSYFFTTQGDYKPLKINHSLLLGAFYHFPMNKFDCYFGLQPGAAMVKQNPYTVGDTNITDTKLKIAPIITGTAGINYFFWKYMNLFAAVKYIHGNHVSQYGDTVPLDEMRIEAGLGFHYQFKKK